MGEGVEGVEGGTLREGLLVQFRGQRWAWTEWMTVTPQIAVTGHVFLTARRLLAVVGLCFRFAAFARLVARPPQPCASPIAVVRIEGYPELLRPTGAAASVSRPATTGRVCESQTVFQTTFAESVL